MLPKVIWVADRGFASEQNRRALMRGGGYIIGEKLRPGSPDVKAAMSRQGRYKAVRDNLQVQEVRLGDDSDRFIICHHPDQAERDAAVRARLVTQLEDLIAGTDSLTAPERARREGALAARPGLKRFLRVTPSGMLRVDKAKIKAGENLDGKYLLRTSDPHMIFLVAVMPSMPGMRTSISATSTRWALRAVMAVAPSAASATTSRSPADDRMVRSPARTSGSSSTSSTRSARVVPG